MVWANKKYYVVFRGKVPGIYCSWPACHSQVNQFSGNLHKSYQTFDEARMAFEQFLFDGHLQNQLNHNVALLHHIQLSTIQQNPSPMVDQVLPFEEGLQGHRPKEHGDNHPIVDQILPFDEGIHGHRQIEQGDNHPTVRQNNRSNQMQWQQIPYPCILFIFVTIFVLYLALVRK
ncbi:hypothetical protein S83_065669 [Arachis hypogaea]